LLQGGELLPDWPTLRFYEAVILYHLQRYPEAIGLLYGLDIPWAGQGPLATEAVARVGMGEPDATRSIIGQLEAREAHPFLTGQSWRRVTFFRMPWRSFEQTRDTIACCGAWTAPGAW